MVSQSVIVENPTGLHARPAAELIKHTSSKPCNVYLEKAGKRINAKSILGLMQLGAVCGDSIEVITDGDNEQEALDELVEVIRNLKD